MDTPTLLYAVDMWIAGEYQCSVEATVQGLSYHINQSVWEAAVGEQLNCTREGGNRSEDTFAVAVVEAIRLFTKRIVYGSCSLLKGPFRSGDCCFWKTLFDSNSIAS